MSTGVNLLGPPTRLPFFDSPSFSFEWAAMERIYLDNAATTWPKPESVYDAVNDTQRMVGAPAGRGGYRQVVETGRMVEQTRGLVAELINAPDRRNIAFTFNGTDSLSTALFGVLRPGDHVVTTVVEHNSVLRPLHDLESSGQISVTHVGCDESGRVSEDDIVAAVQSNTRLVSMIHVSNVTGAIQPVTNLKFKLLDSGFGEVALLLDAAQSLGHVPVDVQSLGCDLLAAPGHKGLLGPLGTGVLYVADGFADMVRPLRMGGTGTDGGVEVQPTSVPEKFESGNLNVPGIAGLNAGIKFLNSPEGRAAELRRHSLSQVFLDGIKRIDNVAIQGPQTMQSRIDVFSLIFAGMDCHDAAQVLDVNWSIQTRAGVHCAPMLHRALGTEPQHGTVRVSIGLFNTSAQVEVAIDAIRQLAESSF